MLACSRLCVYRQTRFELLLSWTTSPNRRSGFLSTGVQFTISVITKSWYRGRHLTSQSNIFQLVFRAQYRANGFTTNLSRMDQDSLGIIRFCKSARSPKTIHLSWWKWCKIETAAIWYKYFGRVKVNVRWALPLNIGEAFLVHVQCQIAWTEENIF